MQSHRTTLVCIIPSTNHTTLLITYHFKHIIPLTHLSLVSLTPPPPQEHLYTDLESQLIEVEESKGLRRIAEQVIGSQQAIIFSDSSQGSSGNGCGGALLDDLPVGMRVIDSCRLAYKVRVATHTLSTHTLSTHTLSTPY